MNIEMSFSNETNQLYTSYYQEYLSLAKIVFDHLKIDGYLVFETNLVSKDTIKVLNRDYRNIDRITDVISFAFEDDKSHILNIQNDIPRVLGEIFICVDKALQQANEYQHSFKREMYFLFVHGLLHLLGYDHIKKEDEEIMFKIQDEIMNIVGV